MKVKTMLTLSLALHADFENKEAFDKHCDTDFLRSVGSKFLHHPNGSFEVWFATTEASRDQTETARVLFEDLRSTTDEVKGATLIWEHWTGWNEDRFGDLEDPKIQTISIVSEIYYEEEALL